MAEKARASDKSTLKIPSLLYERLGQMIEGTGFGSVTELVVYVLRDLVSTHTLAESAEYSAEELEKVKKRLESLGYL